MNKNSMRKKRIHYAHIKATTGAPPQYVKPAPGHKAKVARKTSHR